MTPAKLLSGIDIDISGIEPHRAARPGRHQDQRLRPQGMDRLVLMRGRLIGQRRVDQSGAQPPVMVGLFTRPGGKRGFGMTVVDLAEEPPAQYGPKVHVTADLAHRLDAVWQRGLLARLAPQLGHGLGVALELEAGRGQFRARFLAQQQCLAKLRPPTLSGAPSRSTG